MYLVIYFSHCTKPVKKEVLIIIDFLYPANVNSLWFRLRKMYSIYKRQRALSTCKIAELARLRLETEN